MAKIMLSISVCVMAALFLVGCPRQDPDIHVLTVGNAQNIDHPWNVALSRMANRLAQETEDQITLDIFANSSLGTASEMIQGVTEGTLDIFVGDPTVGAIYAEELELFALPFLFDNPEHWKDRSGWQFRR